MIGILKKHATLAIRGIQHNMLINNLSEDSAFSIDDNPAYLSKKIV